MLNRPNLQLVTKALVRRIVFEGKRAVAVELTRGGKTERAEAEREILLSAGAVNSPHLLQLSGVGDPAHLQEIGVPVVHALPGVGANMQDHYIARVTYPVHGIATANEKSRGLPLVGEVIKYLVTGKGMLTYSASLCAASVKVLPESATPDVQCSFAPRQLQGRPGRPARGRAGSHRRDVSDAPGVARLCPRPHQPARGPARDQPALPLGGHRPPRRRRRQHPCMVRKIFAAPALQKYVGEEKLPGMAVQSDAEILDYARANGNTVYHATCTCMMGPNPNCVVDDQLRVHGLEGLRVIDASVMPAVTSTNTNAPTIMIAEKGAAMIKAAARERLAA